MAIDTVAPSAQLQSGIQALKQSINSERASASIALEAGQSGGASLESGSSASAPTGGNGQIVDIYA